MATFLVRLRFWFSALTAIGPDLRHQRHDRKHGETPAMRSGHALDAPGAVIRRVHGDVTAMMAGGVAARLLQMLHPAALAGVKDIASTSPA